MSPNHLIVILSLTLFACNSKTDAPVNTATTQIQSKTQLASEKPLITLIELGSVKCIPCQKMQPVMRSLETRYNSQLNVVFYDVWQAGQKQKAREYGIRLIPTQVFLDQSGNEIFRHEGFFPETEIDRFLQSHGLNPGRLN